MADLQSSLAALLQVPGLQELLNQSITQQRQIAPVRTGIAQQAANMLPRSAFGTGGFPGAAPNISAIAPANFAPPQASSGMSTQMKLALLAALLGGGGAVAGALGHGGGGAGGNLGNLVGLFKDLFNRGSNPGTNDVTPQGPPDPFAEAPVGSYDPNYTAPTYGPPDPGGGDGGDDSSSDTGNSGDY